MSNTIKEVHSDINSKLQKEISLNYLRAVKRKQTEFLQEKNLNLIEMLIKQPTKKISSTSFINPLPHKIESKLEILIESMKKKGKERVEKDLAIIDKFLNETDLIKMFKKDKIPENNLEKMKYFCSAYINYQHLDKNEILFKTGDIGTKFYIILKGIVNIMKPISEKIKMTCQEYFEHLKMNKIKNENYLLKMTINENNHLYPVDLKDIENLDEISFKVKFQKLLIIKPNLKQIKKFFIENGVDSWIYNFSFDDVNLKNEYVFSQFIYKQLNVLNSMNNQLEKYKYIENHNEKKIVSIYKEKYFMQLATGQYLGDLALEATHKSRSASIVADEETHLGSIDINVYKEYIQTEKQRIIHKEICFIIENLFFSQIDKKLFQNKYYQFFIHEEYYRGSHIFKEDQDVEYVYLVKEGELEISVNKSIIDIHKLILKLLDLKICEGFKINKDSIKTLPKNLFQELVKKKIIKLFLFASKEILGFNEFLFDLNHLYNVKVISERVIICKIDKKNLNKLLQYENNSMNLCNKMAKKKMLKLIERLNDVMNFNLGIIDNLTTERNIFQQTKNKFCITHINSFNRDDKHSKTIKYKSEINENELLKFKNKKTTENNFRIETDVNNKNMNKSGRKTYNFTEQNNLVSLEIVDKKEDDEFILNRYNSFEYHAENRKDVIKILDVSKIENQIIENLKNDINFFRKNSVVHNDSLMIDKITKENESKNKSKNEITDLNNQIIPLIDPIPENTTTTVSNNYLKTITNKNKLHLPALSINLKTISNYLPTDNSNYNTFSPTGNEIYNNTRFSEFAFVNLFIKDDFKNDTNNVIKFKHLKKLKNHKNSSMKEKYIRLLSRDEEVGKKAKEVFEYKNKFNIMYPDNNNNSENNSVSNSTPKIKKSTSSAVVDIKFVGSLDSNLCKDKVIFGKNLNKKKKNFSMK